MDYFRKIRDYVLGEDRSIDREDTSSGRSAPRASGLQAGPPKQAQQQQRQRQQPQGRREQPQGRQDASSAADAVTSTAALPRGPGVLRDVDDGASGGVQGLSWYRARLQQDADGDVAEQFLSEATSQLTAGGKPVGQPEHSLEVQRKRLKRPQTGSMRVEEGNVNVEICGEQKE